jgi:hypothetical protein
VTWEIVAIVLTLVVHVLGAGVLVWNLLDGEGFDWRTLWPRDDDGGGGGRPDPPSGPEPDGGGVPARPDLLPGWAGSVSAPSAVRLREPGRIGEGYPRPGRRPEHLPERPRPGVPERS